jgi:hypothetical protein
VEPWLSRTGIEEHARGLKKDEIHASIAAEERRRGARAVPNARGHGRDPDRGAQVVLRRAGVHADLAPAAGAEPLLDRLHGQAAWV